MHRNILTKYILLFLFSILVANCGGEGSSIENNFIPVSINVFGLIDNDLSYSKQNISIDSNYPDCKYRVTQSLESPKVLHLKSLNDREFSFRNPIIYDENSNSEIRIETIVNSDCPAGSYELNFKIRRHPTQFSAFPINIEDLKSRIFQINDIGLGGIVIKDRFSATICYPTPQDCKSYIDELFGQDAHNMTTGDFNGDGYEDFAVAWAIFPHTIEQEQKINAPINIYLNDGNGHYSEDLDFYASGSPPKHPFAYRVIAKDFNGDGSDDLFAGSMGIQVRKEDYDQNFIEPYPHLLLLSNEEGRLEESNEKIVDDNNGDGMLCGFAHDASAGDVDGDGDIDIFACNVLIVNDGNGRFEIHPYINYQWQWENNYYNPMSSLLEDLNNDGFGDLLFWNFDNRSQSSTVKEGYILLSNGTSEIAQWEKVALPAGPFGYNHNKYNHAVSADFNGDGFKDVAVAITRDLPYYEGAYIQILINNGSGLLLDQTDTRFLNQVRVDSHHGEGNIYVRDMNEDGYPDIIHSTRDYQSGFHGAHIALNDGQGNFNSLNEDDLPMRPDSGSNNYDYLMKGLPIDADGEACLDLISVTDIGFGDHMNQTENYLFTVLNKNCDF